MIQRIQSLYLLLAAALVGVFLTIGHIWRELVAAIYPWVGPFILVVGGLVIVAALVSVFLYRDRQRQRAAIGIAQWLDLFLVLVLVVVIVVVNLRDDLIWEPAVLQTAYITAILPFGAYIFLRMARRGVEKDIALVKSMDRLR